MARSLLIALLSVVAVAGQATALSGPVGLPDPPGSSPLDAALDLVEAQSASAACTLEPCADVAAEDRCRPYSLMFDQNNWPGFQVEYDPDYCIRGLIDDTIDWPPYPVRLFLEAVSSETSAADGSGAATE